jgi:integrase
MAEARARRRKGRRTFGSIEQLPSSRYRASYLAPDGKRRFGETTFATVADASSWLATIETELLRGDWRPPDPARETFSSYGKRWLASRPDLRPSTAERYERLWRIWLEPAFGDVPLARMAAEDWRTWFTSSRAAHPSSTQPGSAYRLGRAILNTAVEDGLLRINPCRVKGAGRETAPERPVVMPDQVAEITENMGDRYRVMVLMAAYCSLRFGELAGLRRARVNILHRTIRVEENAVELSSGRTIFGPPKTKAGRRTVAIPPEILPALEAHLIEYVGPDPDALVFTSPEGHPLRRTKFRLRWVKACGSAGITGLHFHDLRGSGATWAGHAGATLAELMHRLGHTTPNMAMRYQHATEERDRAIAEKLGALMRAAESSPEEGSAPKPITGEKGRR